ncbi:ATP-binding cassette domain-containing protein [candidate division WOR-3 bacterium]|nr:ATP-binding cassette domain-containing protein [candidate division WOR-3 bacterium]
MSPTKKSILEIEGLSLSLNGKSILKDLTAEIWRGYVHAIVGPNGAGKSTLASVIMGLSGYGNFEGEIFLNGKPLKGLGIYERAKLGLTLAWQEPARYEGLMVGNFVCASKGTGSDHKYASKALKAVGLEPKEYLKRSTDKTLSGGERKKIELASIFLMKPKIAILDEPDSGIDVESLQRIFEIVLKLKKMGTTVIMITHSLEVLRHSDHAFLMCDGRIVDKGSTLKISRYFKKKCVPCRHKNKPDRGIYGR